MCIGGYTAVARGALLVSGVPFFGNVRGRVRVNGDRTSYKEKDYSGDDSSGSSRYKTRKKDTTMMTAATTHALKRSHTRTHMCKSDIHPRERPIHVITNRIRKQPLTRQRQENLPFASLLCVSSAS